MEPCANIRLIHMNNIKSKYFTQKIKKEESLYPTNKKPRYWAKCPRDVTQFPALPIGVGMSRLSVSRNWYYMNMIDIV